MKKIFSFILAFIIAFLPIFNINNLSFADSKPSLTAEYAILMDYESGKVLYSKNGYSKLYPASTTKAWTAYVVLKHVKDLNQVVQVIDLPVVEGSSMYLKEGEAFTVKELLDALLIHSCNDVAVVLAKYVGGTVENFVKMMNEEAKAIGAKNTHFNNPHGLPDENHYTTAYDMALMARKAMDNKIFKSIVKTKFIKFPANEVYPYERYFKNTNQFLTSSYQMDYKGQKVDIKYDVVDGIKTGYTDAAGKCLLSTGFKNNIRVISAVFKSTVSDLYLDSRTLLDYGFDNFYSKVVVDKDKFTNKEKISFSKEKELIYQPENNYTVALPNNIKNVNYTTKTNLKDVKLPIKKGDKVGTLEVYKDNKLEKRINLVAKNNVTSIFGFITENKVLYNTLKIVLLIGTITIVTLIIFKKKNKKKYIYKKRRKK